jgi:putative membrane protein
MLDTWFLTVLSATKSVRNLWISLSGSASIRVALDRCRLAGRQAATEAHVVLAAGFLVTLVALLHLYFLVLEMFLWKTPFGRKTFGITPEVAEASAVLAADQGLYNGFLAAGLIWGLILGVGAGRAVLTFFLACVVVAGLFGAATANKRILFVQALPGVIALLTVWLANRSFA